ncbi:uncharacterized protein LOC110888144 [Helianthus annuus]|uniref:uncharacterized protein LOC110888144 n=1 Tax=Helianthus annuus TaxID=4232 RepID=UPI000B8EEBB3|nr:uncharacterized protein LOC110888144 [Helianthus annuus]
MDATKKTTNPVSFAKVVQNHKEVPKVNFRSMETVDTLDGADVIIPLSSVKEVNDRFANTLYGYFLGKRLAFPVVDYFVKNTWAKYGLTKMMMNSNGFFFFKFKTKRGLEQLMEDGPWLIRNVPIILNEWSPSSVMVKEDITAIPVWVKMHNVPLSAFTEDGLSLLATKIGVPKMLDSFTTTMCAESWGRSSFARALIEVNATRDLVRMIKVAVPSLDGVGHSIAEVNIEYDWEPLRCSGCGVFGHDDSSCPKKPKTHVPDNTKKMSDEYPDANSKGKNKKPAQQGFHVKNQKPKLVYRPVVNAKSTGETSSSSSANVVDGVEIDDLLGEIPKFMDAKLDKSKPEGASTPGQEGLNG